MKKKIESEGMMRMKEKNGNIYENSLDLEDAPMFAIKFIEQLSHIFFDE